MKLLTKCCVTGLSRCRY